MQDADKTVRILTVPNRCGWCEESIGQIIARYAVTFYYTNDTPYGRAGTQLGNASIALCEECGRKAASNVLSSHDQSR